MLQDIKGSDIFSDDSSGTRHAAGAVPGLSDAKKKALYSTSVFGQDDPAAAPQVKCLCAGIQCRTYCHNHGPVQQRHVV